MTVQEVREAKKELEDKLFNLINHFEIVSGTSVESIQISDVNAVTYCRSEGQMGGVKVIVEIR